MEWHPLSIPNPPSQPRILPPRTPILPVQGLGLLSLDLLNCPVPSRPRKALARPK